MRTRHITIMTIQLLNKGLGVVSEICAYVIKKKRPRVTFYPMGRKWSSNQYFTWGKFFCGTCYHSYFTQNSGHEIYLVFVSMNGLVSLFEVLFEDKYYTVDKMR